MLLDFQSLTRYSAYILNEIYARFISNDWKYEDKVWSELHVGTYIFISCLYIAPCKWHTYTYTQNIHTLHYLKCNLKNITVAIIACQCFKGLANTYPLLFTEKRIKLQPYNTSRFICSYCHAMSNSNFTLFIMYFRYLKEIVKFNLVELNVAMN